MAERRMFTKKVTDDDNFMSLSSSAQALYLHLSMSSDDDGFCNQVSASMFKAHASVQDLQALLEKRYIYQFESGVIVIKHWRMANALRKDRYTPTSFQEELAQLGLKDNGSYTLAYEPVGKKDKRKFVPPTLEEVQAYAKERGDKVDPQFFFDYFTEGKWIDSTGKPVRNWKQKMVSWEKRSPQKKEPATNKKVHNFHERDYDYDALMKEVGINK